MAISAAELRSKTFEVAPKGYDRPEVHRYLNQLANELQQLNAAEQSGVVDEISNLATTESPVEAKDSGPAEATPRSLRTSSADDFDRVGSEISLMLRQAQESAMKIRSDAELEARTLVDQVREDIEADRVAHEQAAGELIRRTDERAMSIRLSAEDYAREIRKSADEYHESRTAAIDAEVADAESEAIATRKLTEDHLAAANLDAQTVVADAEERGRDILKSAEFEAHSRSEAIIERARKRVEALLAEEAHARRALEETRQGIQSVLDQERSPLTSEPDSSH